MSKCNKCVTNKSECINCCDNPIYADVPRRSKFQDYIPLCPVGYSDCVYDPAYMKLYCSEWYEELYGDKSPEEVVKEKCLVTNHGYCPNYDDEDK